MLLKIARLYLDTLVIPQEDVLGEMSLKIIVMFRLNFANVNAMQIQIAFLSRLNHRRKKDSIAFYLHRVLMISPKKEKGFRKKLDGVLMKNKVIKLKFVRQSIFAICSLASISYLVSFHSKGLQDAKIRSPIVRQQVQIVIRPKRSKIVISTVGYVKVLVA